MWCFNVLTNYFVIVCYTETQISPSQCNLNDLRSICKEQKIWLHLTGSFVAAFPLLKKRPVSYSIILFDCWTARCF